MKIVVSKGRCHKRLENAKMRRSDNPRVFGFNIYTRVHLARKLAPMINQMFALIIRRLKIVNEFRYATRATRHTKISREKYQKN